MPARAPNGIYGSCRASLRALAAAIGLFAAAIGLFAAASAARGADDWEARRLEIAKMSPADQQELLRKQERFLALPPEEQDRLRALEASIDADPHAARLRQVLQNYHEWLKTLSPSERGELYEMSPADRVAKIKQMLERQQAQREHAQTVDLLSHGDMREISSWLEDIAWKHREKLLKDMSPDRRKWYAKQNEEDQRRAMLYAAFQRSRRVGDPRNIASIDEKQIEQLTQKLSEKAQAELAKQPDAESQRETIAKWISTTMIERAKMGRSSRRAALSEADMAQFFQNDLEPRERDRLMNMPQGKMREELRRLYWQHERNEAMLRGGPGGPRPAGPLLGPRGGPGRDKDGRQGAPDTKRPRGADKDEDDLEPLF